MPDASRRARLVDALAKEFAMRLSELHGHAVETIYLGGGTPSIIEPLLIGNLLSRLPLKDAREITLEANPDDVTDKTANAWHEMGINRVSLGVQSMVDAELSAIGRRHNAQQVLDAVGALRRSGLKNYNLDLIYGLPGQNFESWTYSVEQIIALSPSHISAYSLTYEPRTRLSAWLRQGRINQLDEDTIVKMYSYICNRLRDAGYEHYEISNWALPGKRSVHNSSYWTCTPYLGLGPSAHSYDGKLRRINPANLTHYLECIEKGIVACEVEPENDDNKFNDMLITSLRTAQGLNLENIEEARRRVLMRDAKPYIISGKLSLSDGHLMFNENSWLVSDYVLEQLIQLS